MSSNPISGTKPTVVTSQDDSLHVEPKKDPKPQKSDAKQSTVEAYQGAPGQTQEQTFVASGEAMNGADLAAQLAREGAERKAAKTAVMNALEAPIAQLGRDVRNPITATGVHLNTAQLNDFNKAIRTPEVRAAASQLTRNDFDAMIMNQVSRAWPSKTPEQAEQITNYFMKQVGADLRDNAAFEMKNVAVKTFRSAAASFQATANDPDKVRVLAEKVSKLQGEEGKAIRQGLGLEEGTRVTPQNVAEAMQQRAKLMNNEAWSMEERGTNTLFREFTRHDVRDAFMEQAKIRPGSFAAEQVDAVKARGESEEENIEHAKFASDLGVALMMTAAGLKGFGSGFATSLAMSSPDLMVAWHQVDSARAGESAGTMPQGAVDAAKLMAQRKTEIAGINAVASGLISGPGHHVIGTLADGASNVVAKQVTEMALHGTAHVITDAATEAALMPEGPEGHATGRTALERANR